MPQRISNFQVPELVKFEDISDDLSFSQLRVTIRKPQKLDTLSIVSTLSHYGEIQFVDFTHQQVDSSVVVSYFDSRALSLARMSILSSPNSGLSLGDNQLAACIESISNRVPSHRTVKVSGFMSSDSNCLEFLVSVFGKFGEVDKILCQERDSYRVVFFDVRSPMAVGRALCSLNGDDSPKWMKPVAVSSEQLVSLFLMGNEASAVPAPAEAPAEPSARATPSSEFQVNLRQIESGLDRRTTVMIRNIPKVFSQAILVELLARKFPRNAFDFVYLPMDLMNAVNVGYAFVNFREYASVVKVFNLLNNKNWKVVVSNCFGTNIDSIVAHVDCAELSKLCKVSYGRIQGLESLVEHFRSSSIMNQPDSIRPYFIRPD